jgi:hypothetical protein
MGQTQWWLPDEQSPREVRRFVTKVRRLMEKEGPVASNGAEQGEGTSKAKGRGSSHSSEDAYVRYVRSYEAVILPRHRELQEEFGEYYRKRGFSDVPVPTGAPVDACFRSDRNEYFFAEIKPCDPQSTRFAVRTAIGQLLDYSQGGAPDHKIIVLDAEPDMRTQELAISNGFGIAFKRSRKRGDFTMKWPAKESGLGG